MSHQNAFKKSACFGLSRLVLVGGALLLSPALVSAGDKERDKLNKNDKGTSARVTDTGKSAHTGAKNTAGQPFTVKQDSSAHSAKGLDKKPDLGTAKPSSEQVTSHSAGVNKFGGSPGGNGPDFRTASSEKKMDGGKARSNSNIPQSGQASKKTIKPDDLKALHTNQKLSNQKPKPQDDATTDLKKIVSHADKNTLKDKLDLARRNSSKPGEMKLVKDDAKKSGNFLDLHKAGRFDGVVKGAVAKKIDLGKQFELKHKGDLALKLNLAHKIKSHGGWSKAHWAGLIGPGFGVGCSPIAYCGPWYFPSHCLYPAWNPWVEFCWGFHCDPICDPRPWFCRPWWYDPCPVWTCWDYPVWYELPVVVCGTWVDVEPIVIDEGLDLQLLAVRFVDPGHPELREGPRFRVWARNNSARTIVKDFNVLLMAANSREAVTELPQAGVRVDSIEPGEIKAFDIRLPFEASAMGRDADGNAIPFSQLHVLVDSHREIPEAFEENNGAIIARGDILPIDPVIFGSDSIAPLPGTELNIAGEGFGPEPGQVLVHIGGVELQAEIEGWYDLGVRVKLPSLALASPTDAQLIVIRGDTAASNPLTIQLAMPVASR